MRRFVACLGVIASAVVTAQEKFEIKIRQQPPLDKVISVRAVETVDVNQTIRNADGTLDRTFKTDRTVEEEYAHRVETRIATTVLPNLFRRTYNKAVQTAEGRVTQLPHHGKTLRFERSLGRLSITDLKSAEPWDPTRVQEFITRFKIDARLDLERGLLPRGAVAAGESWEVSREFLRGAFESDARIDFAKSDARCTLARVYRSEGHRFCVIDCKMKLAVVSMRNCKFDPPGVLEFDAKLDICLDGDTTEAVIESLSKFSGTYLRESPVVQRITLEVKRKSTLDRSAPQ